MSEVRPQIGVVRFPGSNDDGDAIMALEGLGADATTIWHAETDLPEVAAVVLPGGFSYGDYLRCGAIAGVSPVMAAVTRFAEAGGLVLGICNGFQILCESGLLPGVLRRNGSLRFVCRDVALDVASSRSPLAGRCEPGDRLVIPVKHGEGAYFAPADVLEEIEQNNQVALRYAIGSNPNGSVADIAGVTNRAGNVMGLMPHPEHAVDARRGSGDGARVLGSLVDAACARAGLSAIA